MILARVPDDALPCRRAEQRERDELVVRILQERLAQRTLARAVLGFHLEKDRRLVELEADVDARCEQQRGEPERDPPAPRREVLLRHLPAAKADHEQGQEEAECRSRLDPARDVASALVVCVLAHVGRGTAVLAAEREALEQAKRRQQDRCADPDRAVRREHADRDRRDAHDHDRYEERVFATHEIADAAEHEGAKRPHEKHRRVRRKRREQCGGVVALREEQRREERRQRRVEIEVVPLENGPEG
jgi:hypothetical protein